MSDVQRIRRAIISVYHKEGLADLARGLAAWEIELLSSGGTARALRAAGIEVRDIESVTGFPEILDGRVKTLHPHVHGPLLADRSKPAHMETLERLGLPPIDLVVIDLYPFEEGLAEGRDEASMVELIDIGGPTMVRAAAKNFASVCVVTDRGDYGVLLDELAAGEGATDLAFRRRMAVKAFARMAAYNGAVAAYLAAADEAEPASAPASMVRVGRRVKTLRYGENPHQPAALYASLGPSRGVDLARAVVYQGKTPSYNNYVDLQSCLTIVRDLEGIGAAVVKHNNPCGAATAATLAEAFRAAHRSDPLSAFGGIVGVNRPMDRATAEAIIGAGFIECVIAPAYAEEALEVFRRRKNLRVVACPFGPDEGREASWVTREIAGGFVAQQVDRLDLDEAAWQVVTHRRPGPEEEEALRFAWSVCKNVISNAIVFARGTATVGIGMGQTSRVDAVDLAARRAGDRAEGAVMASDAFFPFRDGIDRARDAGVRAVIQPGGSKRDEEVIAAADEAGMAMVFTGRRHFRH